MDAAISTQSNDAVGAVRTTGKLPLYLACGCPVLASHVGEAARLLGPLGWTIPYDGTVDRSYPERLAQAVDRWAADPAGTPARREQALSVYREAFDPEPVRARVWGVVDELLARSAR
jgi:glycosyltransferase involved in cell wall biosynthesis